MLVLFFSTIPIFILKFASGPQQITYDYYTNFKIVIPGVIYIDVFELIDGLIDLHTLYFNCSFHVQWCSLISYNNDTTKCVIIEIAPYKR